MRGEFLVKARKYEGKTRERPARDGRAAAKEEERGDASFGVAGVIVILALCDLGDLFTSY